MVENVPPWQIPMSVILIVPGALPDEINTVIQVVVDVVIKGHVTIRPGRISPVDNVQIHSLLQELPHKAPVGLQIQHVIPVNQGIDQQHGRLAGRELLLACSDTAGSCPRRRQDPLGAVPTSTSSISVNVSAGLQQLPIQFADFHRRGVCDRIAPSSCHLPHELSSLQPRQDGPSRPPIRFPTPRSSRAVSSRAATRCWRLLELLVQFINLRTLFPEGPGRSCSTCNSFCRHRPVQNAEQLDIP